MYVGWNEETTMAFWMTIAQIVFDERHDTQYIAERCVRKHIPYLKIVL